MALLRKYRSALTAIAAVATVYAVLFAFGITCPIKWITGVSCPGCGMTRAWVRVLHLDLHGAWDFHPLFWSVPLLICAYFIGKHRPLVWKLSISVAVVLFIIVYLFRMLDAAGSVVVFEPHNGFVYRIVRGLIGLIIQ